MELCLISSMGENDEHESPLFPLRFFLNDASNKAPIEGVLLCWSFSLLHVFQSRHVSSLYFCVVMPILVGENCGQSKTTASLIGFPIYRSTNRFLPRDLCNVEVWCLLNVFQTKSGSSTCYSFFMLKLMREIFVAYAISKSPLALLTCSIINRFL